MRLEGSENPVVHPAPLKHQRIGVGQRGPFHGAVAVRHGPVPATLNLRLRQPHLPGRVAVLGVNKLRAYEVARAELPELPKLGIDDALGIPVEAKAVCGVGKGVRDDVKNGPPVSRRARGRSRRR